MRISTKWPRDGFTPEGWSGIADEEPAWTATVVASWKPPAVDWVQTAGGLLVGLILAVAAIGLSVNRGGFGYLLPAAGAVWFGWTSIRGVLLREKQWPLTLQLGPEELRLSSAAPSTVPVVLRRERTGWLVAEEVTTNWHWRRLTITDDADRALAQFLGTLASVHVATSGEPHAALLPDRVPVAVLLGSWWPHPAKRITRQGSFGLRRPWREPGLAGFPRHERRQRLLWSALYAAFAVLCLAAAINPSSAWWIRAGLGGTGIGILAWIVTLLRWHPTFLGTLDR